ncbi:GMC oxidoreductase [Xylaria palmicola]|nr:GMC oxidoreductase [Xylaria palmicola]
MPPPNGKIHYQVLESQPTQFGNTMGLHTSLPDELHEVDIIVVGGGTTGCVVASRLADQHPGLTVLVIEGGRNNFNSPIVTHPALYRANFAPECLNHSIYTSNSEPQLLGRGVPVAVGNCLGGGSSVNGMLYARGQAVDFDSWGAKGWSHSDLLPYFKRFETYHGPGRQEVHGSEGPIQVSDGTYQGSSIGYDFISAMKQLGYPEVDDLHDFHTANGVSHALRYVSSEDGQRQDSAHRYLHPRLSQTGSPNLHVLVESQVTRVVLDDNQEIKGVEYRPNPRVSGGPPSKSVQTIRARKFVVLSAGTFGTPLLLERSGIGGKEVLSKAGVSLSHELPGVGSGYQDHQCMIIVYNSTSAPEDTWDSIYNGTRNIPAMLENRDGMLGWNAFDASAKIRPTGSEIDALGAGFRHAWDDDYEPVETKPLASMYLCAGVLGDLRPFPKGQYFTICSYTTYPYSRGHVHITGPDIDDPYDFRSGFLSDSNDLDLKIQVWAYKKQREIARRMRHFQSEVPDQHPSFPEGSKASSEHISKHGISHDGAIEYSDQDDEAIERFIRERVATTWHPLGTCKMAPLEQGGVVNESLEVHGLKGLKIADMSIVPRNVSGNTMSTALLIGEKAAGIFARELELSRPIQ